MSNKNMIERQILLWAQARQKEGHNDTITLNMGLQNLDQLLFGRRSKGNESREIFNDLIQEEAISKDGKTWGLGQNFKNALASRPIERVTVTGSDLQDWVGKKAYRCIDIKEGLGEGAAIRAALSEIMCQQQEGRLVPFEGINKGRVKTADNWNDFIQTGVLSTDLVDAIRENLRGCLHDVGYDSLQITDLDITATRINEAISNGFKNVDVECAMGPSRCYDTSTGESLTPVFSDWKLAFYTTLKEDNYEPRVLDINDRIPEVIHIEIKTGGDLCLTSGRGSCDAIVNALYAAQVEDKDLPDNFNADAGAVEHVKETYADCGVMAISFGDFFPKPVLDKESGKIFLLSYGETVSPEVAAELAAAGDQDFQNGYFIEENPRYEYLDSGALEFLNLASTDQLADVIASHQAISHEAAVELIEKEDADPYGSLYRFKDTPQRLHLYLPYGRSISEFEVACDKAGLKEGISGGQMGLVLSEEPVDFGDALVRDIDVQAPALQSGDGLTP